ncbi:MAG: UTP--glucose-1-phosphate uridylyltransferase [Clostridiales bacterium]|jgi:UTP--glucose-1-phosphate uridylyltransferase|nr:UTP--glucose-1-phosphate uridylyltransferase [Clostridiales bacterium]
MQNTQKITKAVIPCGGLGTRFLPITKAVPKEILPVIDTPVLGHIVNEARLSGITDVLIILGPGKDAIRNYFTDNAALLERLESCGKSAEAEVLRAVTRGINFSFAVQEQPLGSGHAVLYAEKFAAGEPFALAWGDDLICCEGDPVMGQLIGAYQKRGGVILGVQYLDGDDIVKYGVADVIGEVKRGANAAYKCRGIVEKPPLDKAPSRLCSFGRYILTPGVFDAIRATAKASNGEIQLTDALNAMCETTDVYAFDFVGRRYDMGDKFGSVRAVIEYALKSSEYGDRVRDYLKELVKDFG